MGTALGVLVCFRNGNESVCSGVVPVVRKRIMFVHQFSGCCFFVQVMHSSQQPTCFSTCMCNIAQGCQHALQQSDHPRTMPYPNECARAA